MKGRKITSLTLILSSVLLIVTSIVLYVVPHGRVAYWSNWKYLGLTKTEWTNLHVNIGILFVIAIFVHVYYNWKSIKSYLKIKKKLRVFTLEFNISFLILFIFVLGTYWQIPPFSTILNLSESIKDTSSEKYGEPPYGHAELSTLKEFTKKMKLDLFTSAQLLKEAGIKVQNVDETLQEIAEKNNTSPKNLYLIMNK